VPGGGGGAHWPHPLSGSRPPRRPARTRPSGSADRSGGAAATYRSAPAARRSASPARGHPPGMSFPPLREYPPVGVASARAAVVPAVVGSASRGRCVAGCGPPSPAVPPGLGHPARVRCCCQLGPLPACHRRASRGCRSPAEVVLAPPKIPPWEDRRPSPRPRRPPAPSSPELVPEQAIRPTSVNKEAVNGVA